MQPSVEGGCWLWVMYSAPEYFGFISGFWDLETNVPMNFIDASESPPSSTALHS